MLRKDSLIKTLVLASVLALVPSCADKVGTADTEFLPPPPTQIVAAQQTDTRPVISAEAEGSEEAFDKWVNDTLDWGDRKNLLAYRWCRLWNKFAPEQSQTSCGPAPAGVDDE